MNSEIKKQGIENKNLIKNIKILYGLAKEDGAHAVNEGVLHDQQEYI